MLKYFRLKHRITPFSQGNVRCLNTDYTISVVCQTVKNNLLVLFIFEERGLTRLAVLDLPERPSVGVPRTCIMHSNCILKAINRIMWARRSTTGTSAWDSRTNQQCRMAVSIRSTASNPL